MIPIGDDNRDRRGIPLITWLLVIANILVFVFFQGFGTNEQAVYSYGMVPAEILSGHDITTAPVTVVDPETARPTTMPGLGITPVNVYLTILIAMFMHGGFAHIAGNLLFLIIFGDNVEDVFGHLRFLVFYLLCGVAAAFFHVASSAVFGNDLLVPTLGASGAISGVLGAYLCLFPGRRVRVLLFNFIPTTLHAFFVIGFWFVFQVINGLGYIGGTTTGGGVAYAAHIGGFIAGFLYARRWRRRLARSWR